MDAVETAGMDGACSSCDSANPTLVLRGVDTGLLVRLLQQQRRDGAAVVQMLDAAASVAPTRRGATEPGKGQLVDVVA